MARSELEAILLNFLTNSLKAMDREDQGQARLAVHASEEGEWVLLRFQDNGAGIDPTITDRIFDPFVTTSGLGDELLGAGTGLGLKIVRDIAELNGGSVGVGVADTGYTTCLELRLPRWQAEVGHSAGHAS